MAKHSIQINDDKLYEEIVSYCKTNGLTISFFCTDMLKKQFIIEQYGDIPFGNFVNNEKPLAVNLTSKIIQTEVTKPTGNPLQPYETVKMEEKTPYTNTEIEIKEKKVEETLKPKKRRL